MSEPVLLALVGLGGALCAALLTSILQPLIAQRLSSAASLNAVVWVSDSPVPKFIQGAISDFIYDYKRTPRPSAELKERLSQYSASNVYLRIELKNTSKKAIDGIIINFQNGTHCISEFKKDGIARDIEFGQEIIIGILNPQSIVNIDVWLRGTYISSSWSRVSTMVNITAKEYNKITYKYMINDYIKDRFYIIRKPNSFWFALIAFIVAVSFQVAALLIPKK